jgi:DNA-binding XRE family transcriptional regulator
MFDLDPELTFLDDMPTALTPVLCKAARVLLGWTQDHLAVKAGIGLRSLVRFENETEEPSAKTAEKLYRAIVAADVQLIAANGEDIEMCFGCGGRI